MNCNCLTYWSIDNGYITYCSTLSPVGKQPLFLFHQHFFFRQWLLLRLFHRLPQLRVPILLARPLKLLSPLPLQLFQSLIERLLVNLPLLRRNRVVYVTTEKWLILTLTCIRSQLSPVHRYHLTWVLFHQHRHQTGVRLTGASPLLLFL